jgi:hypothetical protein
MQKTRPDAAARLVAPFAILLLPMVMLANSGFLAFLDITGLSDWLTRRRCRARFGEVRRDDAVDPRRVARIAAAFEAGGARVAGTEAAGVNGRLGVRVRLEPAGAAAAAPPKFAWYVEGSHYEMGTLLGILAEPRVRRMGVEYVDNVVFDFLGAKRRFPLLGRIAADFVHLASRCADILVPDELTAEIWGLWQGSRLADPKSGVSLRRLFVLNYGIDVILSWIYAGADALLRLLGFEPRAWRPPAACNGFAAIGPEFWFGRDFMFPTCGPVFGECAGHIVYAGDGHVGPLQRGAKRRPGLFMRAPGRDGRTAGLQLVFGAPGMVGAVTSLNEHGLAMGVDMINNRSCDWKRVGINSLPMVRFAGQYSRDAVAAVDLMARLPRGVSWLYLLAAAGPDGDRAAAVEAAMKTANADWLRFVPARFRRPGPDGRALLPVNAFLGGHSSGPNHHGLMVRWADWEPDPAWQDWNEGLFGACGVDWEGVKDQWGPTGMLCRAPADHSLPGPYYFAPQRDRRPDLLVAGNNFIIPEMRLLAMNDWSAALTGPDQASDFQWRYDVLNAKLQAALASGPLGHGAARDLINFLRPYEADGRPAEFHEYWGKGLAPGQVPVHGGVCLAELRSLRLETLYGRYADPWVPVSLRAFVAERDTAPGNGND